MVLENSFFLDIDQAASQLAEVMSHYEHNDFLVVVLCDEAMRVANEIARRLKLNLIFTPVDLNTKTAGSVDKPISVDFDYGMVKESGRDIPQDFILHQEQNFRSDLVSVYRDTYESISKTHPDKLIVLVDHLTNMNTALFQCLTQKKSPYQSGYNSFSSPTTRQFVFLHTRLINSHKSIQDFGMIIEDSLPEVQL